MQHIAPPVQHSLPLIQDDDPCKLQIQTLQFQWVHSGRYTCTMQSHSKFQSYAPKPCHTTAFSCTQKFQACQIPSSQASFTLSERQGVFKHGKLLYPKPHSHCQNDKEYRLCSLTCHTQPFSFSCHTTPEQETHHSRGDPFLRGSQSLQMTDHATLSHRQLLTTPHQVIHFHEDTSNHLHWLTTPDQWRPCNTTPTEATNLPTPNPAHQNPWQSGGPATHHPQRPVTCQHPVQLPNPWQIQPPTTTSPAS